MNRIYVIERNGEPVKSPIHAYATDGMANRGIRHFGALGGEIVTYVPVTEAQEAIKTLHNALRLTFGGDPELIDHDKLNAIYEKFGIKINEDGYVEDEDGDE